MSMMRIVAAFFAVLLAGMVGGAIWFPFVPLSDNTMALGVDSDNMPVNRTYTFSTEDEQVVSWLRFARDLQPHQVEWRWISPNGRVYARSFSVVPPKYTTSGQWDGRVWSSLKVKGFEPECMPGMWRVDVIRDNLKLNSEWFTIGGQEVAKRHVPYTLEILYP